MKNKLFQYIRLLDCCYAVKTRSVVLVLDNASLHIELVNLSSFKLIFLAPNMTTLAQSLDQKIIRVVKHAYRKTLLHRILLPMENDKTYPINLLSAIHLLEYSWRQVEVATIQNCFRHAEFIIRTNDAVEADDSTADDDVCEGLLSEVLDKEGAVGSIIFHVFRDIDNGVKTSPELSDSDIVASVSGEAPFTASDDDDEDEIDVEAKDRPAPTVAEAARALEVMMLFAQERGMTEKLAQTFSEFEAALVAARPAQWQTKIADFCSSAK